MTTTPEGPQERVKRPIDRIGTVDPTLANEIAGIVIDETSGYARFSDRFSIAVRVIEVFAGRSPAPEVEEALAKLRAVSGDVAEQASRVQQAVSLACAGVPASQVEWLLRAHATGAIRDEGGITNPAPQAEGDVRERGTKGPTEHLIDAIGRVMLEAWERAEGEPLNASYVATLVDGIRAVLSSGLVVPAAIHKVATDALEAGDACGAVGCRALIERDAALAELAQVTQWHDEVRQECAELRGKLAGIGDGTNEGDQG